MIGINSVDTSFLTWFSEVFRSIYTVRQGKKKDIRMIVMAKEGRGLKHSLNLGLGGGD